MGAAEPVSSGAQLMGALLSVSKQALAPYAKKLQQQAYVSGMQQAASGRALEDIRAEQPWYSRIWGDSGAVEGARAYTAQESASRFVADFETNMVELRKMDPEGFSDAMAQRMQTYSSGDPEADATGKALMFEAMPGLIQRQTKENFKYVQEQARQTRLTAFSSSSATLQQSLSADVGMWTDDQIKEMKVGYAAGLRPTPGADEEAWGKDLMSHVSELVSRGQFHAVNALQENGVMSFIPAQYRAELDAAIKQSQIVYAAEGRKEYAQQWIEMTNDASRGIRTAAEVFAFARQANAEMTHKTGNSAEVFPMDKDAGVYLSALQAQAKIVDLSLTKQGKAMEEAETRATIQSWLPSQSPAMLKQRGLKEDWVDDEWMKRFDTLDRPGQVKAMVDAAASGSAGTVGILKTRLNELANATLSDSITENWRSTHSLWKDMGAFPGGERARDHWFTDPDIQVMFREYDRVLGKNDPLTHGEQAFGVARNIVSLRSKQLDKGVEKDLTKWIDRETRRGGLFGLFATKLTPDSQRIAYSLMSESVASLAPTMTGDKLFQTAWDMSQGRMEVYGKHLWTKGQDRPPLANYMKDGSGKTVPITKELLDDAFDDVVDAHIKTVTPSYDSVQLFRAADERGVAQFTMWITKDKDTMLVPMTSEDLRTQVLKWYEDKAKRRASTVSPLAHDNEIQAQRRNVNNLMNSASQGLDFSK